MKDLQLEKQTIGGLGIGCYYIFLKTARAPTKKMENEIIAYYYLLHNEKIPKRTRFSRCKGFFTCCVNVIPNHEHHIYLLLMKKDNSDPLSWYALLARAVLILSWA